MPTGQVPSVRVSDGIVVLPTIVNFRDAGGHTTPDGARVRVGRLFRSVALDRASDEDLATLADLGVTTIFDLRTVGEQERYPDRLPAGASLTSLDVLADDGEADYASVASHLREPEQFASGMTVADMERFNVETYRDLVRLPSAREAYRAFYSALATDDTVALVHCTGGKDRTGWAVAALLLLLGVDEATVMDDYLISHAQVQVLFAPIIDDFTARGGDRAVVEAMLSAQPQFLRSAVDTVDRDHGSFESYFREGLGLEPGTVETLREAFLQ